MTFESEAARLERASDLVQACLLADQGLAEGPERTALCGLHEMLAGVLDAAVQEQADG